LPWAASFYYPEHGEKVLTTITGNEWTGLFRPFRPWKDINTAIPGPLARAGSFAAFQAAAVLEPEDDAPPELQRIMVE
jgi:hypothetical protein